MHTPSVGIFGKAATFAACVIVGSLFIADAVEQTAPEAERLVAAGREEQDSEDGSTQGEASQTASSGPNTWTAEAEASTEIEIADYESPIPTSLATIAAAGEAGTAERRPIPDLNEPEVR